MPGARAWQILLLLLLVIAAVYITLGTVEVERPKILDFEAHPTPLGYTWSLVLWWLPIPWMGYLAYTVLQSPVFATVRAMEKRAFLWSLAVLTVLGVALDFFFASLFFEFNNPTAVVGIDVPVLGGSVPIEEIIFYAGAFLWGLLAYIYVGFLRRRHIQTEYLGSAPVDFPVWGGLQISVLGGVLAVASVGLAWLVRILFYGSGFPLYYAVIVAMAFFWVALFFPTLRQIIDWRVFAYVAPLGALISVIWEATLAIPYQWWGYNETFIMGLTAKAWSGLPVEAVMVWLAGGLLSAGTYELLRRILSP